MNLRISNKSEAYPISLDQDVPKKIISALCDLSYLLSFKLHFAFAI